MKISYYALHRTLFLTIALCGLFAISTVFAQLAGAGMQSATAADYWDPSAAQTFYVTNMSSRSIQVSFESQSPVQLDSAQYRIYNPTTGAYSSTVFTPDKVLYNPYKGIMTAKNLPSWKGLKVNFFINTPSGVSFSPEYPVVFSYTAYVPSAFGPTSGAIEPNNSPCEASSALPGVAYSAMPDDQYDFFSLNVPVLSRVALTLTNFVVTGQLQFRTPVVNTACSPTTSTTRIDPYWGSTPPITTSSNLPTFLNVNPGLYYARISKAADAAPSTTPYQFSWSYVPGSNPFEPNDNSCAPAAITSGVTNQAYAEDAEDWYQFTLTTTSDIQAIVSNYTASGQYVLYRQGASCSVINFLTNALGSPGQVTLTAAGQPAGTYLLRVYSSSGTNASNLYSFRVNVTANVAVWNANINTCSPMPGDDSNCPPDQSSGTLNVFWINAPGATAVRVILNGMGATGQCPAGTGTFDTGNFSPSSTPSGSWSRTGISKGYYSANLYISGPLGFRQRINMPIKMDCSFLFNKPDLQPTPIGPEVIVTAQPASDTTSPLAPPPLPVLVPENKPTPMP
jgi:hypothetical protein